MTTRQLELIPPRPAPENLPPAYDLTALIQEEHRQAEMLRLRAGYDSCGCGLCQELYHSLDLSVYGSRVIETAGIILIKGKSNQDTDHWTDDGAAFSHYGYRYGVDKKGASFRFADKKDTTTPLEAPLSRGANKQGVKIIIPPDERAIPTIKNAQKRGRPRKGR